MPNDYSGLIARSTVSSIWILERALDSFMSLKDSLIPIVILAGVITHRVRVAISLDKMTLNYGSIILLYVKRYNKIPADETLGINARVVGPANIGMLCSPLLHSDSVLMN